MNTSLTRCLRASSVTQATWVRPPSWLHADIVMGPSITEEYGTLTLVIRSKAHAQWALHAGLSSVGVNWDSWLITLASVPTRGRGEFLCRLRM